MNDKADIIRWFRASSAYINAHRNKIFVVLLTGEALSDKNLPNIVFDLSLLHSLGVKLVLVHGARPQISAALREKGHESQYHRNLRITTPDVIELVKERVGALSVTLKSLFSMGMYNSPMHGADLRLCRGNFITAKPVGVHDGIDFHYTGEIRKIQVEAIRQQLENGNVVMLSNLGYSLSGEVFNLSAERVATETAIALAADKLILMIPDEGVRDGSGELLLSLSHEDAATYAEEFAARSDSDSQSIAQALQAALLAYRSKVHRCHLISYREDGALLRELFTRRGNGSLLSNDNFDRLRVAQIEDVAGILALIKPLETDGTLVQRSRELLENEIGNFLVIELEDTIVACAALYPISDSSGELACIAIDPQHQGAGFGDRLLLELEARAREKGLSSLFVLTTVTAHWFLERGFETVAMEQLPERRQRLYNMQRKSKVLRKRLG